MHALEPIKRDTNDHHRPCPSFTGHPYLGWWNVLRHYGLAPSGRRTGSSHPRSFMGACFPKIFSMGVDGGDHPPVIGILDDFLGVGWICGVAASCSYYASSRPYNDPDLSSYLVRTI